jgi:hypothetical protein
MDESNIEAAEKAKASKKHAVAYLKARASDLDGSLAKNFVQGNFTLASHDAEMLSHVLHVLGQIDLNS